MHSGFQQNFTLRKQMSFGAIIDFKQAEKKRTSAI